MEDELRRKLTKILTAGITEEEHVVYFLVESRKLMDRQPRCLHPTLRMFANWVAHVELSVPSEALTAVLKAFESEYIEEKVHGRKWRTTPYENFKALRTALKEFLTIAQLPTHTADDEDAWLLFAMKYCQVVSDCPITLRQSKKVPNMRYVDKVELVKGPGVRMFFNGQELVSLIWKVTPHIGKPFTRTVGIETLVIQVQPRS